MILVDLSQVMIASVMAQMKDVKDPDENLIRHMVLNGILSYSKQFKDEFGNIVLCCDDKNYWRRKLFPHYKATRKKDREDSDLDWTKIFNVLNKIKTELQENFPYKFIRVESAEADDIIAIICRENFNNEKILILSSDKDFMQLQKLNSGFVENIKQFNPILKKYVVSSNPHNDLKEKIIRGDKGDCIPNILSKGSTFVDGIRQSVINKKKFDYFMSEDFQNYHDNEAKVNFQRNQYLIDFDYIPKDISDNIINEYNNFVPAKRNNMINYFIEHKLKNLMQLIDEF
jgi:5'-3' exonuclease